LPARSRAGLYHGTSLMSISQEPPDCFFFLVLKKKTSIYFMSIAQDPSDCLNGIALKKQWYLSYYCSIAQEPPARLGGLVLE
jgi:hypothetical protein